MFSDNEAYLEKHRTAARTRDIDTQKLGPEFFEKEHTKPLFNQGRIQSNVVGGVPELLGGASSTVRSAVERV